MAQPKETFLACVRPKFNVPGVNFDKLVTANCRFFKARADFKQYVIANALFRGEFQTKWNDDHTAQMMINTGLVKHFIENEGNGRTPKLAKYKKYGAVSASMVRICFASIVAIAHSPFYTGEYYSSLAPLWQQIAQKVKPSYKVVFRSAVDDLIGTPGILWRPIILPNCYKHLINSETEVYSDISIMPWHNLPNVQHVPVHRPLPATSQLPSESKFFRDVEVQTEACAVSMVSSAITKESQTDVGPMDIRNRDVMRVFNKLMERELRRFEMAEKKRNGWRVEEDTEKTVKNQWFPVVAIKRSRSIETLLVTEKVKNSVTKRKRQTI